MRAIVVGAVESTHIALDALGAAAGWELAGLVTLPNSLARRHSDFVDLVPQARSMGGRIIEAADSNAPEVVEEVRSLRADVVFVIGWSQICRPDFLAAAGDRVIGYHPAPLPQMRGRAVIPWTILKGHLITASTLFWVDAGLDTGPILAQRFLHIAPEETVGSLYDRHMEALRALLDENLPRIADGTAPRTAQDERYASWAARRTADDGRIDWSKTAAEIGRLIRAVGRPYPGAFTEGPGGRIIIWHAEPWDCSRYEASLPGQVIARDDSGFGICCGDGRGLWVTDWHSATGRKPMIHRVLGQGVGA